MSNPSNKRSICVLKALSIWSRLFSIEYSERILGISVKLRSVIQVGSNCATARCLDPTVVQTSNDGSSWRAAKCSTGFTERQNPRTNPFGDFVTDFTNATELTPSYSIFNIASCLNCMVDSSIVVVSRSNKGPNPSPCRS